MQRKFESAGTGRSLLEISFDTEEVRDLCERRSIATERLGQPAALALERCLADIEATDNMIELATLLPGEVQTVSPNERKIPIGTNLMLLVRSGHAVLPELSTGETDWTRVTRLRIMAIES